MIKKIGNYIKAGYSGIFLVTHEETRAEGEIAEVAKQVGYKVATWSISTGIDCGGGRVVTDSQHPAQMCDEFVKLPEETILIARDLHAFLGDCGPADPMVVRKIKDALNIGRASKRVLLVLGAVFRLPPELDKEIVRVDFSLPDAAGLRGVAKDIAEGAELDDDAITNELVNAAAGLTSTEAANAFALSYVETGGFDPVVVSREKVAAIKKAGLLELLPSDRTAEDVGGLGALKSWLARRRLAFSDEAREFGLPVPRGVLLTGLPGTGKTLIAKAAASMLGVPLVKLDAGRLFGSLVGESERNLRTVIATAEAIAPCVLLVDEIEKGFSGSKSSGQTDGGTTARVFGTFLQWMNDKQAPVFVIATANDITALPPEFLRKGRFDDLFFVDLPDEQERRDIWTVQLKAHNCDPDDLDVAVVAKSSDRFTGAEIEGCVREALFAAFEGRRKVGDLDLGESIANTVPLAQTMATELNALREWAKGRARRAAGQNTAPPEGKPKRALAKK